MRVPDVGREEDPLIAWDPRPPVDGCTPAAVVVGLVECFMVLLLLSPEGEN